MGLILFLIMGLIAGLIARAIMPGRDPMGWLATMLLGVVGALLGGFLFGGPDDAVGYIGAVVGALIVLFVYRLVIGRNRGATGRAF
ncbi:MAG TPA: GlsB/YeaQ/YmgE family stress response membrane protein [Acidimicrobiales bacterium]|jgi:uncharacterized membrane protein YeaQ/YmgE (transglycosylase-associated protein family)|nr:GlsB/YeaQ/YmgE family stress response membrane protein [Acidimicrobiales bacterium]